MYAYSSVTVNHAYFQIIMHYELNLKSMYYLPYVSQKLTGWVVGVATHGKWKPSANKETEVASSENNY